MEHCFASIVHQFEVQSTLLFPGHEYTAMLLDQRLSDVGGSYLDVPPGQFFSLCADFYNVNHRRNLHDKLPTVPCTLANEMYVNPYLRKLRRHAQLVIKMLPSAQGLEESFSPLLSD